MNVKYSLGNRILAFALCLVMVLGMMPAGTFAEGEETTTTPAPAYGTVEAITEGVSVEGSDSASVKATFMKKSLTWVGKNTAIGRMEDGWWVGLKMSAPTELKVEADFAKVTYQRLDGTTWSEAKSFWQYKDSASTDTAHWIGLWGLVDEETLRAANQTDGRSTYSWKFDWDGDSTYEQTVTLDIDADEVTLIDKNGATAYPFASVGSGVVKGITANPTVSNNGDATIVEYKNITLDWSEADPAAGRGADGWWVGMKITAPAGLTKESDFTNVTYQRLDGTTWSEAKPFWNAKDSQKSDTSHWMGMWGLVTPDLIEADGDKILTYQYRFDWNGDGIYDQNAVMKINANTVTLMKNGIQQLPLQYGKVEAITTGAVTGSETADSVITYKNLTLNWSAADSDAGRNQDGWWVGAKITAPENMTTTAVCEDIKYDNGEGTTVKSFWENQDSDKTNGDTARYLTMWCLVTPELIENDTDGTLTLPYRFDWNQDGKYEQTLTLKIDAKSMVLLDKNNVQHYPSEMGAVTALTGETVTITGSKEASTTVEIDKVALAFSEAKESIGRNQDGWWAGIKVDAPAYADMSKAQYRAKTASGWAEAKTYVPDEGNALQLWGIVNAEYLDLFINQKQKDLEYTWQFDWTGDGVYEQTVTMAIDPKGVTLKQSGFAFDRDEDAITYGVNNNIYTIVAPTGGQATKVEYDVSDTAVATLNGNGTLTIHKAGTVTITATKSGEYFEDISDSYTLTVEKADQADFGFDNPPATVTWQEEALTPLALKNAFSSGNVTWTITEGADVASVAADGKITLLKAGTFTIQAQKAGDDCYNAATAAVEIKVVEADQEGFAFAAETDTVTYNDVDKNATSGNANEYTMVTSGGQSTGAVTYEFAEETDVAEFKQPGVLTIKKAGTVKIKATKAGDTRYNAATAEFTLTVEKAAQSFTFNHSETIEDKYGLKTFATQITPSALNSGKVTYAVSGDAIGATVSDTGVVSFGDSTAKVGTVTVTVTMVEDDCYKSFTDSYTITLGYEAAPATPYTLSGAKILTDSIWYTGPVTITAPEGYQISYANELSTTDWAASVTYNKDNAEANQNVKVYLKNKTTGAITDAISVASLNIDQVAPQNLKISYATPSWAVALEEVTFGLFKADVLEVTLTAEDATSGIANLTYNYGKGDVVKTFEGAESVTEKFTINSQYRDKITMSVTDVAGHKTELVDDKILVLDTINPERTVAYTYASGKYNVDNDIIYTQGDTTISFTIDEANFDLRGLDLQGTQGGKTGAPVIKVNDAEQAVTWTKAENSTNWSTQIELSGNGDYVVDMTFVDAADNAMEPYHQEIHIDNAEPTIAVGYDNVDAQNTSYYKADRTATFTITEHNFKAADVKLEVTAKDIKGNAVDISAKDYAEYAKNPNNWTQKDDVWTLKMGFDVDAHYALKLTYTDLAGNVAAELTDAFVIDKTKPDQDKITITYKTSLVDEILGDLFGFTQSDVEVEIKAEDMTAGVDYFVLTYTQQDGKNTTNRATYVTEKIPAVQDATDKSLFTATHTIPKDARGTVTVDVVDKAGNAQSKADEKVLVLDDTDPLLTVAYLFTDNQSREYNNIYYTQDTATVRFTIDEANFDLSLLTANGASKNKAPVATVNGVEQAVTWTQTEGNKWMGEVVLTGNGDYVVKLTYTDRAGNAMVDFSKEIHIDNVKPVIAVTYDNNAALNTNHYKADRTATVKVTEHNFNASEVVLKVDAKDIKGNAVDISAKKYSDYAKDPANWSREGDVWTLDTEGMKFDIEASYALSIDYTELSGNVAASYTDAFVVDKTKPQQDKITITYTESLVDEVLGSLFSFYQSNVEVKVSAEDVTSGVDYFEITYLQKDGKNTTNKPTYKTEKIPAVQDATDKSLFTATHTIPKDARGTVTVDVTDKAGNMQTKADGKTLVLDDTDPVLNVEYLFNSKQNREYNNIFYTQDTTTVRFTIDEANFDLSLLTATGASKNKAPVATVNSTERAVTWTQVEGTNKWVGEVVLTGNGDYVVKLTYADRAGNAMVDFSKEIHIDNVKPVFNVAYDQNAPRNGNKFNVERTATVKVTEHNFKADEVKLTVTAKDIKGNAVDISAKKYSDYAKDPANWTNAGDVWTLNTAGMKFDIDAIYNVKFEYTDLAENVAAVYTSDFVIDKTDASNIQIAYSASVLNKVLEKLTFGFYQAEVEVTVTAEDMTAGVESFTLTYTKQTGASAANKETFTTDPLTATQDSAKKNVFTASYKIPANARGTVSVKVLDQAGNDSTNANSVVLVVDNVAPTREVLYTPYKILDKASMLEVETYAEGDNSILYYKDKAVVTFKITEANFDLSLKDDATKPVIKVNNTPVTVEWTKDQNSDVWTAVHTITGNGDYVVTMSYKDLSTNQMVGYESCKIAIDGTAPVVGVTYTDGTPTQTIEGTKYYKTTQTVAIQVTEHNFRADDVVLTVTAKDVQGNAVDISAKAYADYAKNRANWTSKGDVHTLNTAGMVFDTDAIYTFDIAYDDICDNFAADYAQDSFVVDHAAPTGLQIAYSAPVAQKVIESLTFGFYKPSVTVTLTVDDATAGVDFFDWTYTKQADSSDVNTADNGGKITTADITYANAGKTATATFTIPANARGHVSASVTDRSGNSAAKADNTIINVVDNIAPAISVTYAADSTDTKVQFVDAAKATVDSFDKAVNAFYNGNVTAKIVIDEANFFEGVTAADGVIHQVGIKLTKTDDNGNVTVTEYLPTGAAQMYEGATAAYITWTTVGDVHSFDIPYADDADYVLEIAYTDLSTNDAGITANDGKTAAKSYTSKVVTVDKTAPVIAVTYGNTEVINTIDDRQYFNKEQSAVVTVTEHNFRASDVQAVVTAVNFLNVDVAVADFAAQLADESNWTHEGNVHTANIAYTVDANYSFDIDMVDLAQNASADYAEDLFAVDTTAPTKLTVSYSTNVFQQILQSVTFGYYNATMTVTITADDATTGIHHFGYSYINSENVSSVNAELLNQAIQAADIKHKNNTATATFTIPKLALGNNNQFNGTVEFIAYDRSENSTELKDSTRIIVDNISPTATITYNNPVQNSNGISYYAGNIEATIVINEANFDSRDVVVTVTKDGANYPVSVSWTDNSVDTHTGRFVLTEDGDYFVNVQYKDKSGNQMNTYTSNELTLDTVAPSIKVSNIKANSANKDDKYSFVITFDDINLDASTLMPILKAVKQTADSRYEVVDIDLGEVTTVVSGQTYTYTIENLPDDGLYTLICEVKDMSANTTGQIVLDDNQTYDQVQFSINRDGSTFGYGNTFTEGLVGKYYIYSVDEDVVIVEVNVDPIEDYTVTLNGEALVEGTDYTTTQTSEDGQWSKRTYSIKKSVFAEEGEYNIIVSSTDKAKTTAFSDVKKLSLSFVVDQTKPALTISGLAAGGRYQTDLQTVTLIPTDEGGRLNSLKVVVLDSNGKPYTNASGQDVSVRFEMSGEELLKFLEENDGMITFTIPTGLNNKVRIICNDCAVDAKGMTNTYDELFENVTVSPNQLVIFYANKPAFYGTVGGVIGLAALTIILIKRKKSKTMI